MIGHGSYYNVPGSQAPMSGLGCGCSLGTEMQLPPVPIPPQPPEQKPASPNGGWWDSQTTEMKVAFGAGAALLAGGLLYLAFGGGGYTPNLSPSDRRRKVSKGKVITVKGGRRFGHAIPPKRYWKQGAKRKSDYAWSSGYKYPLVFRHPSGKVNVKKTKRHIRSAKTYFKRSKRLYPMVVRRKIARRINAASKRYAVGPTVVKP